MRQPWSNQSGELPGPKAQSLREEAPFIRLLEGEREEGVCAQPGAEQVGVGHLALSAPQKRCSW